jgi:hypothetical protein
MNPAWLSCSTSGSLVKVVATSQNDTFHITKYLHMWSTELCLASSKILTPHPLTARRECTPAPVRGEDKLARGRGGGGSIFWKTPDIGLASYSSLRLTCTVISLWDSAKFFTIIGRRKIRVNIRYGLLSEQFPYHRLLSKLFHSHRKLPKSCN